MVFPAVLELDCRHSSQEKLLSSLNVMPNSPSRILPEASKVPFRMQEWENIENIRIM